MAAGSISDERFDDYCYNSVMDNVNNGTGEYKYVEALRLTSSGVGLLSSFTTVAFVLIGHGCAKIVHGFFLFYGTFGALLSASQLMMALSCRPASKREDVRSIYSVADCTSCYFRFALYLLMCWVSLYIVIAMCKKKQTFKGCSVKIAAVSVVLVIPLSCAWGPVYAALNCQYNGTGTEPCKMTYYSVAAAFVSTQSVAHVTCAAVGIALAAKLFRGICGTGRDENLLYHKKTFRKLPAIFVAMLVALLIFAVDLTVTAATLASKRANARLPPDQAFYVLEALPLLSTVLVPLLYFCLVCDRNGKNSRQAAENDSGATSVEAQSPKPTRRGSYGALNGANRQPN